MDKYLVFHPKYLNFPNLLSTLFNDWCVFRIPQIILADKCKYDKCPQLLTYLNKETSFWKFQGNSLTNEWGTRNPIFLVDRNQLFKHIQIRKVKFISKLKVSCGRLVWNFIFLLQVVLNSLNVRVWARVVQFPSLWYWRTDGQMGFKINLKTVSVSSFHQLFYRVYNWWLKHRWW